MATAVDDVIQSSVMSGFSNEAIGAAASRTRAWDNITIGVTGVWTNGLVAPTVFAAQGIRMLNGTPTMAPGNAPNANTP